MFISILNMSQPLYIEEYSEKAFVLRGEQSKEYKDDLSKMHGRWNPNLAGGPGWVFSKKRIDQVCKYFLTENNLRLPIKTTSFGKRKASNSIDTDTNDRYIRKLRQKITNELTDELTSKLTHRLTRSLTKKITDELRSSIEEKVRQEYSKPLQPEMSYVALFDHPATPAPSVEGSPNTSPIFNPQFDPVFPKDAENLGLTENDSSDDSDCDNSVEHLDITDKVGRASSTGNTYRVYCRNLLLSIIVSFVITLIVYSLQTFISTKELFVEMEDRTLTVLQKVSDMFQTFSRKIVWNAVHDVTWMANKTMQLYTAAISFCTE